MFERYTPPSRRAIYFAREYALREGASEIDSNHILRGVQVDQDSRANTILRVRELLRDKIPALACETNKDAPKDIPLTHDGKRILAYAAEEAGYIGDYWIDTDHLVLGILREIKCPAAITLNGVGLYAENSRNTVMSNRSSRPQYGPVPLFWPRDKPTPLVWRWRGLVYLLFVLLMLLVAVGRFCGDQAH